MDINQYCYYNVFTRFTEPLLYCNEIKTFRSTCTLCHAFTSVYRGSYFNYFIQFFLLSNAQYSMRISSITMREYFQ